VLVELVVKVVDKTVVMRVVDVVGVTLLLESADARLLAIGVPQPVTGSHPTAAEYPLLEPEVMSWNIVEYEGLSATWYNCGAIIPNCSPPLTCNATPRKPAQRGVDRLVPATPSHSSTVEYSQKKGS
jgi:hypothetical protein